MRRGLIGLLVMPFVGFGAFVARGGVLGHGGFALGQLISLFYWSCHYLSWVEFAALLATGIVMGPFTLGADFVQWGSARMHISLAYGLAGVSLFVLASVLDMDMKASGSSHNLLGVEWLFDAFYGLVIAFGTWLVREAFGLVRHVAKRSSP